MAPRLVTPLHLQAELADAAVANRLQVGELLVLEGFQRPPGGAQGAPGRPRSPSSS
jgi:hypothetical protein